MPAMEKSQSPDFLFANQGFDGPVIFFGIVNKRSRRKQLGYFLILIHVGVVVGSSKFFILL
jgi:hypothetical protein